MKVSNLLLGLGGLIPATVLLFSAREFNLVQPEADFGHALQSAVLIGLISAWSCYIVSLYAIMRDKDIPTSLEGMGTAGLIALPFAAGMALLHSVVVRHYAAAEVFFIIYGIVSTSLLQGFFIGYSKARLADQEARGFIFRIIGLGLSAAMLTVFLFVGYMHESPWSVTVGVCSVVASAGLLGLLYMRAARQRKRYMSRRYKPRSAYRVETTQPTMVEAG